MEVELLKKYGSVSPGKIENLDGTTETVDFRFSTAIRFYHNMEDADFPLHWHAPGEIISPIEGTYTVTIAGKTVTLQPHDVLIIASGELHSIRAPKTGERYIMNYSVSYFHQIQDMAELFNTFYPFRLVTRQEDPELADQLFAVLAQIEGEYFSTNVCRESEIMALMLHFFSIFGRYEHRQNSEQVLDYPKQQDHMRRFAELCAYINNMPELLAAADLVISRAGALTLAELEAVGRAAVLIPSPNVAENHQYYNAMELQKAGAAVVIEEKDLTGEKLVQTVSGMLAQPGKLAEMGRNARSLSVDDSLDRIADALLKLVKTP